MSATSRGRKLVTTSRMRDYGDPAETMRRTALAWSALLGTDVSPKQVALCMAALKLVRESRRHKRDNLDDAAGYVEIASTLR